MMDKQAFWRARCPPRPWRLPPTRGWNGSNENCRLPERGARRGLVRAPPHIVVGSKNFTEQVILGEILAQQIERRLGVRVERRLNLGGTLLAHEALVAGLHRPLPRIHRHRADGRIEAAARRGPRQGAGGRARRLSCAMEAGMARAARLQQHLRHDRARRRRRAPTSLRRSPTRRAPARGVSAWAAEFAARPDGLPGLLKAYGLRSAGDPVTMDLGLLYSALASRKVDMIAANSTDGPAAVRDVDHPRRRPPLFPALRLRRSGARANPGALRRPARRD